MDNPVSRIPAADRDRRSGLLDLRLALDLRRLPCLVVAFGDILRSLIGVEQRKGRRDSTIVRRFRLRLMVLCLLLGRTP